MRNNELPVSFWDVTGDHHCIGRGTQNADAVFGCSNAGVFILRSHDVIGVVGLEVGSTFFVQNLCTLIGAESLWVPTEVRDKALVAEDEVIFGVQAILSTSKDSGEGFLRAFWDLKAENGVFFRTEVFLDSIFSF
jgi:hypothetical protein